MFAFPYVIQVKSRRLTEGHFHDGPNGRPQAMIAFRISKSEFDLLSSEDRSYLVCVAFPPLKANVIGDQVLYFWIKGSQLVNLREHTYLREVMEGGKSQYALQACFRFLPTNSRHKLLERLEKEGKVTPEGAKELEKLLPAEIHADWGSEYISLYRCPWSSAEGGYHGERTVAKQLRVEHLDIARIGTTVSLPTYEL